MYQRHVLVRLQYLCLFFQLLQVSPEIIACTVGNICSASSEQTVEVIVDDALVPLVGYQMYLFWMLLRVLSANVERAVGRAVLAYNNLDGQMALLGEDAVERSPDGCFVVIGGDDDRYEVLHFIFLFE